MRISPIKKGAGSYRAQEVKSRAEKFGGQFASIIIVLLVLAGCGTQETTYTLYRSSISPNIIGEPKKLENMRIHVATFDSNERDPYNQENCRIAMDLFQSQQGVMVRYWCEKGRYRP